MEGALINENNGNSWIHEDLFLDALGLWECPKPKIKIVKIVSVTPPGENYLGKIWRVEIEIYDSELLKNKECFVIKELPEPLYLKEFIRECGLYKRELSVYTNILPVFQSTVRGKLPRELQERIAPKFYYSSKQEVLILEDLKPLGYKMGNRLQGLDLEHCVALMKTLARFHALSLDHFYRNPSAMNEFNEHIYTKQHIEKTKTLVENAFLRAAEMVESWPDFERFGNKLRRFSRSVSGDIMPVLSRETSECCVLNHGDLWVNNILFSYSTTGEVSNVKLVDFQLCRFASLAIDLHYFFITSLDKDVREHHLDHLIKTYHAELCMVASHLGYNSMPITLSKLIQELRDKQYFALYVSCCWLPMIVADTCDAPDFSKFDTETLESEKETAIMSKAMNGNRFKEMFKDYLLMFENDGLF